MTAPTPKPGQRWRVSHRQDQEGVVIEVIDGGVRLRDDSGTMWTLRERGGWFPAERLPDPEPEWQPGDLVLDADGRVLRRRDADHDRAGEYPWYFVNAGDWGTEADAHRPLRRLVVEDST